MISTADCLPCPSPTGPTHMGARPKTWLAERDGRRPMFGTKHHTGWLVLGGVSVRTGMTGFFFCVPSELHGRYRRPPPPAAAHRSPLYTLTLVPVATSPIPSPKKMPAAECYSQCSNTCIGAASPVPTMVVSRSRSLPAVFTHPPVCPGDALAVRYASARLTSWFAIERSMPQKCPPAFLGR